MGGTSGPEPDKMPAEPPRFLSGVTSVEVVEYRGWKNNLRLTNGDAELIVTLDVGPRVISYRLGTGVNVTVSLASASTCRSLTNPCQCMVRMNGVSGHGTAATVTATSGSRFPVI